MKYKIYVIISIKQLVVYKEKCNETDEVREKGRGQIKRVWNLHSVGCQWKILSRRIT